MTVTDVGWQVGESVEVHDRYWQGGMRVAALTDSGKVYVEAQTELPAQGLRLVTPDNLRRPHTK
jgi:hypothetical protein